MRKRIGILILLICSLCMSNTYAAFPIFNADFKSMPEGWTESVTSGAVTAENGELKLSYDSAGAAVRAKAEVDTAFYDFDEKIMSVSLDFEFNGANADTKRALAISDDDSWGVNAENLFEINNKTAVFFGDEASAEELSENTKYSLSMYMDMTDTESVKCRAYLNGELAYSGEKQPFKVNFDSVKFRLRNYLSKKSEFAAEWLISKFSTEGESAASYTLNVSDGETVIAEQFKGFDVSYGGIAAEDVYAKENYNLYKDGEKVGFNAVRSGSSVSLAPLDGFESGSEYTLEIISLTDIFQRKISENIRCTVRILPEGYVSPEITLTTETAELVKEGVPVVFTAAAVSSEFDKTVFYVNGTAEYTAYEENSVFELLKNAGIYEVYAAVYDKTGCKAASETVTVTVEKNDAPTVAFSDYSDTARLTPEQAKAVNITASDSDGIQCVKLYKNGREVSEAVPNGNVYTADLSVCGIGTSNVTAKAFDIYGKSGEASISIEIYASAYFEKFRDGDFAYSGTETKKFTSGIYGYERRGYVDTAEADTAHGTCLRIGYDADNTEKNGLDRPYITIPARYDTYFETEYDIMFSAKPETMQNNFLQLMYSVFNSGDSYLVRWDQNMNINGKKYEYEINKWYTVNTAVDFASKRFTVTVSDENGVVASENWENKLASTITARFYGGKDGVVSYYAMIDNFTIRQLADAPEFIAVKSDKEADSQGRLPYDSAYIEAYLSSAIYGFNSSKIKLLADGAEVETEKVGYNEENKKITIYPKSQLRPNYTYTIVLSGETEFLDGYSIGADVTAEFTTTPQSVEVSDISFEKEGQSLKVTAKASNHGDTEKNAVLVVSVWKENTFKQLITAQKTLNSSSDGSIIVSIPQLLSGEKVIAEVWDSFTGSGIYARKTY